MAMLAFGAAASATTGTAATAGLFGAGGAFSMGTTLMTVGTAVSTIGGIAGVMGEQALHDYNADIYKAQALDQAAQAGRDAAVIHIQTMRDADILREKQQREKGLRMKQWGKSGVAMTGSPLLVFEGTAYLDEEEMDDIITSGERKAEQVRMTGMTAAEVSSKQAGRSEVESGYSAWGYGKVAGSTLASGAKILQ